MEKLPPPKGKQIDQILDAFHGSEKVKKVGLKKRAFRTTGRLSPSQNFKFFLLCYSLFFDSR